MRQIIIGGARTASPPASLPPAPPAVAAAIPAERWIAFLSLVRDIRTCQALTRRTMDPMLRREGERLEYQLDAEVGWLVADLAAAGAVLPSLLPIPPAAMEGGGL